MTDLFDVKKEPDPPVEIQAEMNENLARISGSFEWLVRENQRLARMLLNITKEYQEYLEFINKDAISDRDVKVTSEASPQIGLFGVLKKPWEQEWQDMPEFEQKGNHAARAITVRFRSEDDVAKFEALMEQNITDQTKGIWYPKLIHNETYKWRWISTEENSNAA